MSVSLPPLLPRDPSLPLAPPLPPLTLLSQKRTQGESDAPLLCPRERYAPLPPPFASVHARTGHANAGPHGARHPPFAPASPFTRERGAAQEGRAPFFALAPVCAQRGAGRYAPLLAPLPAPTGHTDARPRGISPPPPPPPPPPPAPPPPRPAPLGP